MPLSTTWNADVLNSCTSYRIAVEQMRKQLLEVTKMSYEVRALVEKHILPGTLVAGGAEGVTAAIADFQLHDILSSIRQLRLL